MVADIEEGRCFDNLLGFDCNGYLQGGLILDIALAVAGTLFDCYRRFMPF